MFRAFKIFPSKTISMIFISKRVKLSTIQNYSFPEGSKKGCTEQSCLPLISILKIRIVWGGVGRIIN